MTDLFEVVPSGKIRNWFQSLSVIVRLFISLTADDLFSRLSLHKTIFFTKRVFFHVIPLSRVLGCSQTVLNYGPFHIYILLRIKNTLDFIRAFDYNPTPNLTELCVKKWRFLKIFISLLVNLIMFCELVSNVFNTYLMFEKKECFTWSIKFLKKHSKVLRKV